MIIVNNIISSKYAIRGALGNINMPNIELSISSDLERWAIEAMNLISKKAILQPNTAKLKTEDNKIKMCDTFKALECVKLDGKVIPFINAPNCQSNTCTSSCNNCNSSCVDSGTENYGFYIKGCYIKFINAVEDGLPATIEYWELSTDEEGNIMVLEEAVLAIQEYITWMLKRKFNDQTYRDNESRWYVLCKQARGLINKKSDDEIKRMGKLWFPINFRTL